MGQLIEGSSFGDQTFSAQALRRALKIARAGRSQAVPGERWLDSSATLEVTSAGQNIIESNASSADQITTTTTTSTTPLRNLLQRGANQAHIANALAAIFKSWSSQVQTRLLEPQIDLQAVQTGLQGRETDLLGLTLVVGKI